MEKTEFRKEIAMALRVLVVALLGIAISCSDSPPSIHDDASSANTDAAMASFPIGTYRNCASGAFGPNPNVLMNTVGFESLLKLEQSGTTLTATHVRQSGITQSLVFSKTTSTSATLASSGQVIPGFSALCVLGLTPDKQRLHPALMKVSFGTLTYTAGTIFIHLNGVMQADAGSCGPQSSPKRYWIQCGDRQNGALPKVDVDVLPSAPQFPVGKYSCNSQIAAHGQGNGLNHYASGGGAGALTLTQANAQVSAQYAGSSVVGTLRMVATSSTTAHVDTDQTLTVPCTASADGTGVPSQTAETLPITAGAFTVDNLTLSLSFAGTMMETSSCPGVRIAGTVICARQ